MIAALVWFLGAALLLITWPVAHGWQKERGGQDRKLLGIATSDDELWLPLALLWPITVTILTGYRVGGWLAFWLCRLGTAAARHPKLERRARIQAEMKRLDAELKELEAIGEFEEFDERLARAMKARVE